MIVADIIRAAIPGASDELCEFVLWERTVFPCDGIDARTLYKTASRTRRAAEHGIKLCDFCDNRAIFTGLCRQCHEAMCGERI